MKIIRKTLRSKLLGVLLVMPAVTVVCLVAAIFVSPGKLSAATFTGYFAQKSACYYWGGSCQSGPQYQLNDVLTGRLLSDPNNTYAMPNPAKNNAFNNKLDFETWIIMRYNLAVSSGSQQEQTGTSFVINTMMGAQPQSSCSGLPKCVDKQRFLDAAHIAEFKQRIENPDVSMNYRYADPCNYAKACPNVLSSFYDGRINDDFYAYYNSYPRWLLVFTSKSTGNVLYVLEVPCGNPLGGLPGLPSNDWDLSLSSGVIATNPTTGNVRTSGPAVELNVSPGDIIQFKHTILNNGPADMDQQPTAVEFFTNSFGAGNSLTAPCVLDPSGYIKSGSSPPCLYNTTTRNPIAANSSLILWNQKFTIPPWVTDSTEICAKFGVDPIAWNDNSGNLTYSKQVCVKVVVPAGPPATCSSDPLAGVDSSAGTYIQQGDTTTLKFTVGSAVPVPRTVNYTITYTNPNPPPPNLPFTSGSVVLSAGSTTSGATSNITFNAAGQYNVTWWFAAGSPPGNCSDTLNVYDMPYFSVYGSSVRVGGNFSDVDPSCSGGGMLGGWYNNIAANPYGSGTQLAAIALANIVGFASSQPPPPSPPFAAPSALSFANTSGISSSADSPGLGGNFGHVPCLTDPSIDPGATNPGNLINLTPLSGTKNFRSVGNTTFDNSIPANPTMTVGNGANITVVVKGDILINDNIVYNTSNWMVSPVNNIPSLRIIADGGDIYIDDSVSQLDGLYVAKTDGSGNGGTIYTCSRTGPSFAVKEADPVIYTNCAQPLEVHGTFVANQINLQRTFGTVNDIVKGYVPAQNIYNCQNHFDRGNPLKPVIPAYPSCAAEVFNFSPEMYLANPPSGGTAPPQYDSITSLPPVL